ncbi:hypothetical protein Dsin_030874 [Dipteronia sinensis]|uniref:Reverse transcriptase domain-containing protein n=1 Tax=Dipteronia sinensis TaxID=43782 RepID=A0AAE0DRM4_9ROSI|nr:hypothetical protein Dsin_030874 [Dipteronia sinensis]
MITRRLTKLKPKMQTSSGVSDDYCPLLELSCLVSSSWLVVGDFNVVLGAHESLGLRSPGSGSCEDFRFVIEDCDFIGVLSQGARFTWVRLSDIENISPILFLFQSMWLDHPDFMALVRRIWSSSFVDEFFLAKSRVHHELDVLLHRHECFYRDWSRVKWLQDGDCNSSFFHASIKRRQYMNVLSSLSINGVLTDDRLIIRDHIIEFYSNLFSSDSSRVETKFFVVEDVIPSLVTDVENAFLISIPSMDDINDAVFAMDAASTHRPDGFSRGFYQQCWEVVGSDVVLAVQYFFRTWVILSGLNSSFIVLLPKLKDSISIDKFRLIVLSNLLFKIFSKLLADRLAQIAARIVSPHQFGFIRDRHIEDCIALASECVNVMYKKCYGGNLAMKIDIRKAFDTLDWSFLRRVLQAFGFSPVFIDWIDSIL